MKSKKEVLKLPRFQCYKDSDDIKGVFYSEKLHLYFILLEDKALFQDGVQYSSREILKLNQVPNLIIEAQHICKREFEGAFIVN